MRTLGFSLLLLVLAGCAGVPPPQPLTAGEVVALAREGRSSQQIIEELDRTRTVLLLQASDFVRLHDAGVPDEVLDYLQRVQIDAIRWRERYSTMYWDPFYYGYGPCPWGYPFTTRPYRGGPWGC